MDQVEVDVTCLEAFELLLKEAVHVRPGLDQLLRQLGGKDYPVSKAARERAPQEGFALPRLPEHGGVIEPGCIHVVYTLLDGLVQEPGGGRFVDLLGAPEVREAHATEAENGRLEAGTANGTVEHGGA